MRRSVRPRPRRGQWRSEGPLSGWLHWGLENNQLTAAYLGTSPLGTTYKAGFTRIEAFKAVSEFLRANRPAAFDSNFSTRLGL